MQETTPDPVEPQGPGSDPAKRRQILDGAGKVFLNSGFSGSSMGEIARTAGVSKGTLYAYFQNKEALFVESIECQRQALFGRLFEFDDEAPVERELRRLGRGFARYITSPPVIATMRAVIGIAEQMPELSCAFFDRGPGSSIQIFAAYLERQAARGELEIDDPRLAAVQFLDLCQASLVRALLFGKALDEAEREAQVETVVASALRMFLAAYRVPPPRR